MSSSTGKVALGAAHTFRRQWAQGPPPVLRNSNRRLDHVVLLERLPLSATPSDVARLQDALTPFGMSKRFPSEVVFLRTKLLKPSGRALFAFSRPAHADNFAKLANGKSLGGQQISAQRIAKRPPATSPTVALLYELQSQSPGRVVLIQGLPRAMDADRLFRILSRDYQLAPDRIEIDLQRYNLEETEASMEGQRPSTVGAIVKLQEADDSPYFSTFFVRLQSVSDAMRLVRGWHRSVWNHRRRLAQDQERLGPSTEDDEGEAAVTKEEQGVEDELWADVEEDRLLWAGAKEEIGSGHQRLREAMEDGEARPLPAMPGRHIIDARIMY